MDKILNRITIKDDVCNGKPTIRVFRVSVQTIIEFLLAGSQEEEILFHYPFLEKEDIIAAKAFLK